MLLMIKHHRLSYSSAFRCLPVVPLLHHPTRKGCTGSSKAVRAKSDLCSEWDWKMLDFVYVYQHLQFTELCWEECKKRSLVSFTKWSQTDTGKVQGQIPFHINTREANEQTKLRSFDFSMSLARTEIRLKFLLFSSALLLLLFCAVRWMHLAQILQL